MLTVPRSVTFAPGPGQLLGVVSSSLSGGQNRLDEERRGLRAAIEGGRVVSKKKEIHGRTVDTAAGLLYSLNLYTRFAVQLGAITAERANEILKDASAALEEQAATQKKQQVASDPTTRFLELLGAAIVSGSAHVVGTDGECPESPYRWGWRARMIGTGEHERLEWQPQGDLVGWVDDQGLYLEPTSSYNAAQRMARNGEPIPVASKTLNKRLGEQGLLVTTEHDTRGEWTIRKQLAGERRKVLHIKDTALSMAEEPAQSAQPAETSANSGALRADSAAPKICPKNPPTDSAIEKAIEGEAAG